jgi:hypothetical protein
MAGKLSTFVAVILASNIFLPMPSSSQVEWIGETRTQAEAKLPLSHQSPTGETLVSLARVMLGRPYRAFSLDAEPTERLRLDLTSFDCVLFVEQLLALINSRTIDDFPKQVKRLRYANAEPDYCQRNHYFSVWAKHAEVYGPRTALLYQVGGFFEIYDTENLITGTTNCNIRAVAEICQLSLTQHPADDGKARQRLHAER